MQKHYDYSKIGFLMLETLQSSSNGEVLPPVPGKFTLQEHVEILIGSFRWSQAIADFQATYFKYMANLYGDWLDAELIEGAKGPSTKTAESIVSNRRVHGKTGLDVGGQITDQADIFIGILNAGEHDHNSVVRDMVQLMERRDRTYLGLLDDEDEYSLLTPYGRPHESASSEFNPYTAKEFSYFVYFCLMGQDTKSDIFNKMFSDMATAYYENDGFDHASRTRTQELVNTYFAIYPDQKSKLPAHFQEMFKIKA